MSGTLNRRHKHRKPLGEYWGFSVLRRQKSYEWRWEYGGSFVKEGYRGIKTGRFSGGMHLDNNSERTNGIIVEAISK